MANAPVSYVSLSAPYRETDVRRAATHHGVPARQALSACVWIETRRPRTHGRFGTTADIPHVRQFLDPGLRHRGSWRVGPSRLLSSSRQRSSNTGRPSRRAHSTARRRPASASCESCGSRSRATRASTLSTSGSNHFESRASISRGALAGRPGFVQLPVAPTRIGKGREVARPYPGGSGPRRLPRSLLP